MAEYKLILNNATSDDIERHLKAELWKYRLERPLLRWQFWAGAVVGAIMSASADYGDVHFCVGQCDGKSPFIAAQEPTP